jgi:hypothetical protein
MPGTSAYIQVSRYALLEYQYNSELIPVSASPGSAGAIRLENKYLNTYQFLNNNQSVNLTGNVLDRSAARMGDVTNKWAYFDIDTAVPIYLTNSNFVVTDQTANLVSLAGRYDNARLHILSGFDFPGLDGVILQIQWKEWKLDSAVGNRVFDACNHVYLRDQPQIQFNTTPLFLGDRLYDRYIEVKVPSLYDVNQDFWNSPTATNTIGYNYTFNNVGFLQNSQIYANLYEIDSSEVLNGNLYLYTGNSYKTAFNPADNYSQLGLVIQENSEYDYIEYYPTWNGAFLETYINDLNSVGGDWVVINQIELYEQVGTGLRKTANMTMLQDSNFDQPGIYRPVILNSSIAFSYTIDYTMRFFNRVNNTEIIRKSSYTSTDVKKYGKQLDKINVLQGFTPVKAYNRIVKMEQDQAEKFLDSPKEVITQKIVTPVYYDKNMISVDSTSNLSATLGESVWPQGTNTIFLSAFDNMIKFKLFTKSVDKNQNVSLDLSSFINNVAISFDTTDTNRLYIPAYIDINLANPAMGEVAFKIDPDSAVKILASTSKNYFIVNRTNPETIIYTGKFRDISELNDAKIEDSRTIIRTLETRINQLTVQEATAASPATTSSASLSNSTTESTTFAPAASSSNQLLNQFQQEQQAAVEAASAELTLAQAAQADALQRVTTGGPKPQIIDIPGVTANLGANPQINIRPLVQNPADPSTGENSRNNPSTQGNTRI